MKPVIYLVVVLLIAISLGCNKEERMRENCIEKVLDSYGMNRYKGEELGCRFFLRMYEFQGKQYFYQDSHCADVIGIYHDCEGNQICTTDSDSAFCQEFYKFRIDKGIVGIR